jgi:hypothetical protein
MILTLADLMAQLERLARGPASSLPVVAYSEDELMELDVIGVRIHEPAHGEPYVELSTAVRNRI